MKYIIIPILVALFCSTAYAEQPEPPTNLRITTTAPPACSTPTGDIMTESFEGTGYDLTWTEPSGTPDEDAETKGSPDDNTACDQSLECTVDCTAEYAYWDYGSTLTADADLDITVQIYIDSVAYFENADSYTILRWGADTETANTDSMCHISLTQHAGATKLFVDSDADSATAIINPVVEDTWYTLFIHLDATDADSYVTVNGGEQVNFTKGSGANARYLMLGPFGLAGAGFVCSVDMQFGYVNLNSP